MHVLSNQRLSLPSILSDTLSTVAAVGNDRAVNVEIVLCGEMKNSILCCASLIYGGVLVVPVLTAVVTAVHKRFLVDNGVNDN